MLFLISHHKGRDTFLRGVGDLASPPDKYAFTILYRGRYMDLNSERQAWCQSGPQSGDRIG